MKKIPVLTLFCSIVLFSSAQNVGVGTSTPTEKLDVNGNINLTGTIKANGTDGQPNEVLMKNSSGNLAWGSLCNFKNFKQFTYTGIPGPQPFIIPAGVTRIAVELWGGGGGGSQSGGGGAGGYAIALFDVTPGQTANVEVGAGGQGSTGTGNALNGGETRVTYLTKVIGVYGGFGATTSFPGNGGLVSTYSSDLQYISQEGSSGRKNRESYQQISATDFVTVINYGNGGTPYGQPSTGGEGGYIVTNINTGITIKEVFGGQAFAYGEGGGGGKSFGYPGAGGRIIVRW